MDTSANISCYIESHDAFHFRVEPRLLPTRRLYGIFEAFVFENTSFASTLLALFGKIQIEAIIYRGNVTHQEDQWQKKTTSFGQFILIFDKWTTIKFKHCLLVYLSNRPQVSMVYRLMNYVGYW